MVYNATFVGLTTLDLLYSVDAYPAENTKAVARRQATYAGGPATNAALAFACLGGKSRLVTAVGQHRIAARIRDELRAASVELADIAAEGFVPPISSIVVSAMSGSRTVVSTNATGNSLGGERVEPGMLARASLLLVDGHHMELATVAAREARKSGVHVVFDGGSWKEGTENLLEHVDTAICSEVFRPPQLAVADTEATLDYLSRFARRAAITRGARPILYRENGVGGEVPIRPVEVVDTLAAGDIFHGAYCYFHCAQPGTAFADLLRQASAIASLSCGYFGPREWTDYVNPNCFAAPNIART